MAAPIVSNVRVVSGQTKVNQAASVVLRNFAEQGKVELQGTFGGQTIAVTAADLNSATASLIEAFANANITVSQEEVMADLDTSALMKNVADAATAAKAPANLETSAPVLKVANEKVFTNYDELANALGGVAADKQAILQDALKAGGLTLAQASA